MMQDKDIVKKIIGGKRKERPVAYVPSGGVASFLTLLQHGGLL